MSYYEDYEERFAKLKDFAKHYRDEAEDGLEVTDLSDLSEFAPDVEEAMRYMLAHDKSCQTHIFSFALKGRTDPIVLEQDLIEDLSERLWEEIHSLVEFKQRFGIFPHVDRAVDFMWHNDLALEANDYPPSNAALETYKQAENIAATLDEAVEMNGNLGIKQLLVNRYTETPHEGVFVRGHCEGVTIDVSDIAFSKNADALPIYLNTHTRALEFTDNDQKYLIPLSHATSIAVNKVSDYTLESLTILPYKQPTSIEQNLAIIEATQAEAAVENYIVDRLILSSLGYTEDQAAPWGDEDIFSLDYSPLQEVRDVFMSCEDAPSDARDVFIYVGDAPPHVPQTMHTKESYIQEVVLPSIGANLGKNIGYKPSI